VAFAVLAELEYENVFETLRGKISDPNNFTTSSLHQLKYRCQRLYETKHDSEKEDKGRDPKRPPLHRLPIVSPPLQRTIWLMIVERLFQLPQSNPPKYKVVDSPLFWL
jgi:hypothetical protein